MDIRTETFLYFPQTKYDALDAPSAKKGKRELGGKGTTDTGSAEHIKVNQTFSFVGNPRRGKKG